MAQLRPLSARPELVVDDRSRSIADPAKTRLAVANAPLGRERVLFALPLNGSGPVQLGFTRALDGGGGLLVDPDGKVVGGSDAVFVHRMLYARWTEDTRRLG